MIVTKSFQGVITTSNVARPVPILLLNQAQWRQISTQIMSSHDLEARIMVPRAGLANHRQNRNVNSVDVRRSASKNGKPPQIAAKVEPTDGVPMVRISFWNFFHIRSSISRGRST